MALIKITYRSAGNSVFPVNNSLLFIKSFNINAEITIISRASNWENRGLPIFKNNWNKGEASEKWPALGLSNPGSQKSKAIIGNRTNPVKLSDL